MSNFDQLAINEESKKLVIERLKAMSGNLQLHVDGYNNYTYTKDELIKSVSSGNSLGQMIIKEQLNFVQAVASGRIHRVLQNE